MTFKVSQIKNGGILVTLDNLGFDELDAWMDRSYGKFATVLVEASNGKKVIYTDNGSSWEKVSR
jgi:hypothetical protein